MVDETFGGDLIRATVDLPTVGLDVRALFERRYGAMARLAGLLTGDLGRGEEIAQDAFAILFRRAEAFPRPDEADAYLRTVVVNLARSALRRNRLARRHAESDRSASNSPNDAAEALAQRDLVLGALRRVSLRQRQCLVLRYYEDLSEAEVASTLGLSVGSVKTHTSRGVAALARMIGEHR